MHNSNSHFLCRYLIQISFRKYLILSEKGERGKVSKNQPILYFGSFLHFFIEENKRIKNFRQGIKLFLLQQRSYCRKIFNFFLLSLSTLIKKKNFGENNFERKQKYLHSIQLKVMASIHILESRKHLLVMSIFSPFSKNVVAQQMHRKEGK